MSSTETAAGLALRSVSSGAVVGIVGESSTSHARSASSACSARRRCKAHASASSVPPPVRSARPISQRRTTSSPAWPVRTYGSSSGTQAAEVMSMYAARPLAASGIETVTSSMPSSATSALRRGQPVEDAGLVAAPAQLVHDPDPHRVRRERVGGGGGELAPAREHGEQQGGVAGAAGQRADAVELGRERDHAAHRHQAGRGRHADDPALRRRLADRAAGVGADRQRRHAGRDGRGRAATAAAGAAPRVPGVAGGPERRGLRRGAHRQLVHVGPPEQDRPGLADPADGRSVAQRDHAGMGARPARGRLPADVDVVLDHERHAGQRADGVTAAAPVVDASGLLQRALAGGVHEGTDRRVEVGDLAQMGGDDLFGADLAARDEAGDPAGGERRESGCGDERRRTTRGGRLGGYGLHRARVPDACCEQMKISRPGCGRRAGRR